MLLAYSCITQLQLLPWASTFSVVQKEVMQCCGSLQWLFILEGGPAVLLGLLVCWRLPPDPERAAFLQPAERQWCLDRWTIALLLSIALMPSWEQLHYRAIHVGALQRLGSGLCGQMRRSCRLLCFCSRASHSARLYISLLYSRIYEKRLPFPCTGERKVESW